MSMQSKSWYKITKPVFQSGFEDDELFAYGQSGFDELLYSAIGSDVDIYDHSIHSEPKHERAILQNRTADALTGTTVRQILCKIGTLKCGQYINENGVWWMVSALPDNNRVYEKAVLWKCKHTLRFISPATGNVVSYPVYSLNSTQYGTGEKEKQYMAVGDAQHLVYVPRSEDTILVDNGFRFLIGRGGNTPAAYRITQVDHTSYAVGEEFGSDGILQWSIVRTQYNEETDNAELLIADYREQPDAVEPDEEDISLELIDLDGDGIVVIGEEKDIEVRGASADSLSFELMNADGIAEISGITENVLSIKTTDSRSNIGKVFTVKVVCDETGQQATLDIQVDSW